MRKGSGRDYPGSTNVSSRELAIVRALARSADALTDITVALGLSPAAKAVTSSMAPLLLLIADGRRPPVRPAAHQQRFDAVYPGRVHVEHVERIKTRQCGLRVRMVG
jgi:hypothetical protein